jgi:hypothetical protein
MNQYVVSYTLRKDFETQDRIIIETHTIDSRNKGSFPRLDIADRPLVQLSEYWNEYCELVPLDLVSKIYDETCGAGIDPMSNCRDSKGLTRPSLLFTPLSCDLPHDFNISSIVLPIFDEVCSGSGLSKYEE